MAKVSQSPDPSMEEILASIRRIISDDEAAEVPARTKPDSLSTEAIDALFSGHVQPASETYAEPVPAAPRPVPRPPVSAAIRQTALRPDAVRPTISDVREAPIIEPRAPHSAPLPEVSEYTPDELPVRGPLLSPAADAAVGSAFGDLSHTLLSGQARTLEDLVKDMLRPMLKSWLDSNLPPLVERLVRDEIERVSRGR